MPSGDDFIAIIKPALEAKEKGWQALGPNELLAQHFSHRILPVRALAKSQVLLLGKLNFETFMWVGILSWLSIYALLVWQAKFTGSGVALLFTSLVWFQPQAAANCLAAMQAASNMPVLLFALIAFSFRTRIGPSWWLAAWLIGTMATMTTGNGLLVPLILLIWDAWEKRGKRFVAGLILTALIFVMYFAGFTNPESQKYASSAKDILGNILVMTGAILNLGRVPLWVVAAFGASLGLWALTTLIFAVRHGEKILAAVLFFVGGSILLASFARAGWGNEYMLQDRYLVYPIILLSACGGRLVDGINSRKLKNCIVFFGMVFAALSWWHYTPKVISNARSAEAEALGWQLGFPGFRFSADKKTNMESVAEAVCLLQKANEKHIFSPRDSINLKHRIRISENSYVCFGEWNGAASGYLVPPAPAAEDSVFILFEADGWWQVGFRPAHRIALGRFLLGQHQIPWSYVVASPPALMPDLWKGEIRTLK